MNKWKLLSFKPLPDSKFQFVVSAKNENFTIILKERMNWPVLIGQPLEMVENWLMKTYGWSFGFLLLGGI